MPDTEFYKRRNIRIVDTNKRFHRMGPIRGNRYFENVDNKEYVETFNIEHLTERLITLEIPESDLERIKDFEDQVFNNMKTHGSQHYYMFNTMMEQKEEEKYLRDKYPSVQKAFEQYSMLLALAKSGEI